MSDTYLCNVCEKCVRISDSDSPYAKALEDEKFLLCLEESCGGKLVDVDLLPGFAVEGKLDNPTSMTAEQLFKAVHGFGLPSERMDPKSVVQLLKDHRVLEVHGNEVGKVPRLIVDRLVLDGGWNIHFASSNYGATVFKVTRDG